ncbi:MAG TPA: hypothetical protein VGB77_01205 [Abditibacteriaceae bacterium]|jgi:hypothetical protein
MQIFRRQATYWRCWFLLAISGALQAQNAAPPVAPIATPRTSTSYSKEFHQRLRKRIEEAVGKFGPGAKEQLGAPGGLHWIFLLQVARYPGGNVRQSNTKKGMDALIGDLIATRQKWSPGQVNDTISFIPYHFNILGSAGNRQKNLSEFLARPDDLKAAINVAPQADKYQGKLWKDGHDWRAALQQTLEWMQKNDIEPRHSVIVVVDWDDVVQAPQTLDNGSRAQATSNDLVQPENKKLYDQYLATLQQAGFDGKQNLSTVQAGTLEYAVGIFTTTDLAPLPTPSPPPPPTPTPTPIGGGGNRDNGGGPPLWLLLLPLLAAAAAILGRSHRVKINGERVEFLRLLGRDHIDIIVEGGTSNAPANYALTARSVGHTPATALATIRLAFPGKITVTNGAFTLNKISGFQEVPGGLLLTASKGEAELLYNGQRATILTIEKM